MAAFGQAELEALHAKLEAPMFNVVLRRLWDREEARDVVQETFVRLWAMRARIVPERVEPLAYRIALNLARSHLRRRRIRTMLALDRMLPALRDPRDPEADLVADARGAEVRAAIAALPEDVRDVVLLTAFTPLSHAEIGSALGIPAGTVGSRRHRALRLLRERLGEDVRESAR